MKKHNDFYEFGSTTYNNENKSFNFDFTFDNFYIYYFSVVPMFDAFKFSVYNPHKKGKDNAELICSISGFRKDPTIFIDCLFNSFMDNFMIHKTDLQKSLLRFIQYVESKKIISN